MKTFPEKGERTLLVLLVVLFSLMVITAAGGSYYYFVIYKKPVAKTDDSAKNSRSAIIAAQVKDNKLTSFANGKIKEASATSVTITDAAGKDIILVINDKTAITQGPSLDVVKSTQLKVGSKVNASYNNTNQTALNIYISEV
jgi:hypothetical protein